MHGFETEEIANDGGGGGWRKEGIDIVGTAVKVADLGIDGFVSLEHGFLNLVAEDGPVGEKFIDAGFDGLIPFLAARKDDQEPVGVGVFVAGEIPVFVFLFIVLIIFVIESAGKEFTGHLLEHAESRFELVAAGPVGSFLDFVLDFGSARLPDVVQVGEGSIEIAREIAETGLGEDLFQFVEAGAKILEAGDVEQDLGQVVLGV